MIKKCILAISCWLPLGLLAQKGFTVHGSVGNVDAPAKAILTSKSEDKQIADTVLVHHGKFTFSGQMPYPFYADLYIIRDTITQHQPGYADAEHLHFFLENSDITITAADSIQHATVKGSVSDADNKKLLAMQQPFVDTKDSLTRAIEARSPEERKDAAWLKSVDTVGRQMIHGYNKATRDFIYSHLNSFIALGAFHYLELASNFNPDSAAARFARFPASQRESVFGKKIQSIIDKARRTDVGNMAMDFSLRDSTGKTVSLSDFRGHYVLLDFWASWCVPCRAENPNYLKNYNDYKDKNFTILGVSLDDERTKDAWLKAIKDDNLPWTQLSELKGFSSKPAVLYGVQAIPSNFLIDPNGKIVGKNLRGEALGKKLNEIFSM